MSDLTDITTQSFLVGSGLMRDRESFSHAYEISKPWGQIDQVLDWTKASLTNEWRWQLIEMSSYTRPGRYIFYFDSERDYLAFVLRWG